MFVPVSQLAYSYLPRNKNNTAVTRIAHIVHDLDLKENTYATPEAPVDPAVVAPTPVGPPVVAAPHRPAPHHKPIAKPPVKPPPAYDPNALFLKKP